MRYIAANRISKVGLKMTSINPIMYSELEKAGYIDNLEQKIKDAIGTDADLLLEHPAIYIHVYILHKCSCFY